MYFDCRTLLLSACVANRISERVHETIEEQAHADSARVLNSLASYLKLVPEEVVNPLFAHATLRNRLAI
jgi:hypothetical protein